MQRAAAGSRALLYSAARLLSSSTPFASNSKYDKEQRKPIVRSVNSNHIHEVGVSEGGGEKCERRPANVALIQAVREKREWSELASAVRSLEASGGAVNVRLLAETVRAVAEWNACAGDNENGLAECVVFLRGVCANVPAPPIISSTIAALLATLSPGPPSSLPSAIMWQSDVRLFTAAALLREGRWSEFKQLGSSLDVLQCGHILFPRLIRLASNSASLTEKQEVLCWCVDGVGWARRPLSAEEWHTWMCPLVTACGADSRQVQLTKYGADSDTGDVLAPPNTLDKTEMEEMRRLFHAVIANESGKKKSVFSNEVRRVLDVARTVRSVAAGRRVLIVDTLNVTNGGRREYNNQLVNLLDELRCDFPVMLLISRNHMKELIDSIRLADTRIFTTFCANLSDDDLPCLLSALEIGQSAYLVSNDHYDPYSNHLRERGLDGRVVAEWLRERSIRHKHYHAQPPVWYHHRAYRVSDHSFSLPVVTGPWAQLGSNSVSGQVFSHHLITLPDHH